MKANSKAAQSLADPMQYENLFPELKQALQAEEALKGERRCLKPAERFSTTPVSELSIGECNAWSVYELVAVSSRQKYLGGTISR